MSQTAILFKTDRTELLVRVLDQHIPSSKIEVDARPAVSMTSDVWQPLRPFIVRREGSDATGVVLSTDQLELLNRLCDAARRSGLMLNDADLLLDTHHILQSEADRRQRRLAGEG